MKTKLILAACLGALALHAAEAPKAKPEAGPRGGRLLEKSSPKTEFFLEKDRTVSVAFYSADLKPLPAGEQAVTVIVDNKGKKEKLELAKKGDVLASATAIAAGDEQGVVVQLREKADAKPQNFRFTLAQHECGGCKRPEYACTCDEH